MNQFLMGSYDNPIVKQAMDERITYFERKSEDLYSLRIYYVVSCEGFLYRAIKELKGYFARKNQTVLVCDTAPSKGFG